MPRQCQAATQRVECTPVQQRTRLTLAPDINRGMTAGMDCVDVNAHLDDTGRSHGTNQGLMRVDGRDRGTSQACLETQEEKAHGNAMETPRENDKLTLEQPAQVIDERIHKDSKLTELKLNPRTRTKDTTVFRLTKADGNDDEFFQRKEEDRK